MGGDSDERTVYVRNLDDRVTKEILEELFVQVGTVASVFLKDTKPAASEETPQPKNMPNRGNFAFIEFQDEETVLFAVEMMDDIELFGKRITVAPRDRTEQAAKYRRLRDQFRDTRNRQSPSSYNSNRQSSNSYNNRTPTQSGNYNSYDQAGRNSDPRHYGSMNELHRHQGGGGMPIPLYSTPVMQPPYSLPYHSGGGSAHQLQQQNYQGNRHQAQHHQLHQTRSNPPFDRRSYNNSNSGSRR
uniref:RRM domain-containing protein n=1 Tax=Ditylenchus dipsaci TaxID=166011 RepID=A0A915CXD3_9BILA